MVGIQFYGEEGDEVILDDQVQSWFYRTKVPSLFMAQTAVQISMAHAYCFRGNIINTVLINVLSTKVLSMLTEVSLV